MIKRIQLHGEKVKHIHIIYLVAVLKHMKQFPCKGKNKSHRSKPIKCLHCKDRHAGLDIFKEK